MPTKLISSKVGSEVYNFCWEFLVTMRTTIRLKKGRMDCTTLPYYLKMRCMDSVYGFISFSVFLPVVLLSVLNWNLSLMKSGGSQSDGLMSWKSWSLMSDD